MPAPGYVSDVPALVRAHDVRSLSRRVAPFAALVAVCAVSPVIPLDSTPDGRWWACAVFLLAVMFAVGLVGVMRRSPRLVILAPLLLAPAVQLLRATDGNAFSGFNSMLMLEILWYALYGTRRLLWLAIASAAATLLLPLVIIGSPQYPSTTARGVTLLLFVMAGIGVIVHRLVATARRAKAQSDADSARFEAVFEHAPVGMALTTGPISADSRFELVNRSLCALVGRSPAALMQTTLGELVHSSDLAELLAAASADTPADVRLRHRAGHPVWATVSCAPLQPEDGAPRFVWQLDDISAQRAADVSVLDLLDTERRASQRLRVAEREHRQLLASISHDLRTPITAALGYAELLADGEFGSLTTTQQRTADVITRSLGNLSRIINELVVIGPEMAKDDTHVITQVEVADLVDDAIQLVAIQAAMRSQQIQCERGDDEITVSGDPIRLSRVLVNLLGNAVKFTPVGGTITVTVRRQGSSVAIAVADSGPGISTQDQQRIFERFYRAPRETNDPITRGSGLGLAIVKAITVQHGGSIDVASAPGEGATFTVRLPLAGSTHPAPVEARRPSAPSAR